MTQSCVERVEFNQPFNQLIEYGNPSTEVVLF